VPTASGRTVPLSQIATLRYGLEDGLIWKRNRVPTITVMGDIYRNIQAPTVSEQLEPQMDKIRATLPLGYRLETGGATEESAKANASINAGLPIFLVAVLTLLMPAVAELPACGDGAADRTARSDWRGDGTTAVQSSVRLCRHAGHARTQRHDHAQFGYPDRAR